ncbi:MAG: phosphodiesterase [Spirochaetaceae bacterium]|nr:phosphodiesterase [Spirochaetaceae bacterium]
MDTQQLNFNRKTLDSSVNAVHNKSMKYLIASDIHGSASAAEKILSLYKKLNPDFLVLLGDLLYHGPRNPLPGGHGPQQASDYLNFCKDSIIAVRGNCDAEIDQMLLEFPCMNDYALLADGPRTFFLTHGHLYNEASLPFSLNAGSIYLSGHTHVWRLEEKKGIIYCNPGSAALPKGPSPVAGYAFYDGEKIGVYSLEGGKVLAEMKL